MSHTSRSDAAQSDTVAPAEIPENAEHTDTRPLAERVRVTGPVAEPVHADVATWRPATPADIDILMQLHAAADTVDHPTWATPRDEVEELFEFAHVDPARDTRLGFTAEGQLVALAVVMVHPVQDQHVYAYGNGVVHPEWRRRGIGREVLRWEHETAQAQLAATGSTLPGAFFVHAHEPDVGARTLGAAFGMREERWFTTMVRDMSLPIPDAETDLEIVPMSDAWVEGSRQARNDAFRDHWGSLETPADRWRRLVTGTHARQDLSRLIVDGDRVAAFALVSINEDDWELQGYSSAYIEYIGVVRDYRGRRLAPTVIAAMLRAVRDEGLQKVTLDVDTESPTGATSLYTNLGFEATDREVALVSRY